MIPKSNQCSRSLYSRSVLPTPIHCSPEHDLPGRSFKTQSPLQPYLAGHIYQKEILTLQKTQKDFATAPSLLLCILLPERIQPDIPSPLLSPCSQHKLHRFQVQHSARLLTPRSLHQGTNSSPFLFTLPQSHTATGFTVQAVTKDFLNTSKSMAR